MAMGSGQRVGLLVLTLCGMAALASLVAPFWLGMSIKLDAIIAKAEYKVNVGLYFACTSVSSSVFGTSVLKDTECRVIGIDQDETFNTFQVGRLLCLLSALLILLLGPCLCCACCCCGDRAASVLGGTSVFSGLLGLVGGALCMHATKDGVRDVGALMAVVKALATEVGGLLGSDSGYQWASYLYLATCCLLLLTGIVLVVLPKRRDPPVPQVLVPMVLPGQASLVSSRAVEGPPYQRL